MKDNLLCDTVHARSSPCPEYMIENIMWNLRNTRRLQIVAQLNSVADPGGGGGGGGAFRLS